MLIRKGKKENLGHSGHQHSHRDMQRDPLRTENHNEHVAFLKDRYGFNIYGGDEAERLYEEGKGPYVPPVDVLFRSGKDEKKIEESLDRSYELTKESMGKSPEGMTRRNFLKVASLASAAAGVAMAGKGFVPSGEADALSLGPVYWDPVVGRVPMVSIKNSDTPASTGTMTSQVAVVKRGSGDTIQSMVNSAIAAAGGLGLINQGESVLIKPNTVAPIQNNLLPTAESPTAPVCTNPEVLRAVIKAVKTRTDAKNIWVADQSMIFMDTVFVMQMVGLYDVCMQEEVNCCSMGNWSMVAFTSSRFEWLPAPFNIAGKMLEFDHMINVPVLKNHEMPGARDLAQFTNCLKAFIGVLNPNNRFVFSGLTLSAQMNHFHGWNLPEKLVELNLCRPWRMDAMHSHNKYPGITMNIVDATDIMTEGGPVLCQTELGGPLLEMKVAHPNMIIASTDRVACDSVSVAVLKKYALDQHSTKDYTQIPVWAQRQIRHAAKKGLGINDPNRIDIIPQGLSLTDGEGKKIYDIWKEGYDPSGNYSQYGGPTPFSLVSYAGGVISGTLSKLLGIR